LYQALYSNINDEGFIETPALKIFQDCEADATQLINKIARNDIVELDAKGNETTKVIVAEGHYIDEKAAQAIEKNYKKL